MLMAISSTRAILWGGDKTDPLGGGSESPPPKNVKVYIAIFAMGKF